MGPSAKTGAEWRWWPEDPSSSLGRLEQPSPPPGLLPSEPPVTQQNPCVFLALKDPLRLFLSPPTLSDYHFCCCRCRESPVGHKGRRRGSPRVIGLSCGPAWVGKRLRQAPRLSAGFRKHASCSEGGRSALHVRSARRRPAGRRPFA